jgi:hypothetical protein
MIRVLVQQLKGGDPVSKSLASIAIALGFAAMTAGSAWAECSGTHTAQTAADQTQTASTGTAPQQTPKPETKAN